MDKETLKSRARELRNNMTPQERKLWWYIRNRQFYGYRFLRQYCIGSYIADFVCLQKHIVIEIDGGQHNQPEDIEYDKRRTSYLNSKGYTVVRFWNHEINTNIEGVYLKLQQVFGIDVD